MSKDSIVRAVALFDNEECGSGSYQGALSNMLEALVRRISCPDSNPSPANYELALANSFLLSSDQAHAVHPNYRYVYMVCTCNPGLIVDTIVRSMK